MTRTIAKTSRKDTFVVYVTYPDSTKEYAYLCNIKSVRQGDTVLGNNNARVIVRRTADFDPNATRYVLPLPDMEELQTAKRRVEIQKRLNQLYAENNRMEIWEKLAHKNTEARKLVAELKKLIGR